MESSDYNIQILKKLMISGRPINHDKIIELQNLHSEKIAEILSSNFGVPLFDLDSMALEAIPIDIISEKLITDHNILPLYHRGNQIYIATDDPSKHEALQEIQFHTGLKVQPIVVETKKLKHYIHKLLNEKEKHGLDKYADDSSCALNALGISVDVATNEDAPIVKFINKILQDAVKKSASDIHFEPYEQEYRIRYRQDGILHEVASPPASLADRLTARIKVMSNLDIAERRVPQDGRFKIQLSQTNSIDCRVSTCPTIAGEKIVVRILDPGATKLGIEVLGFSDIQKHQFLNAINKPQGMILVTGPTGSGKTVSLYTALNILNNKQTNISTVEDPVEIKVPGINQVNINIKAGLTFSNALRAFLRQDPDVIMVGEIRDFETAEIAIKAAQTGHLVLSTLHTNSAAETLTRLINMGIPSFNIASSISLIIAQRLGRKLCEHCKTLRDDYTQSALLELGFNKTDLLNIKLYKAMGCNRCTNGYKGRLGLFEVMPMSKTIGEIIMHGGNSIDILKQAKADGMLTIYQSGLEKIRLGLTSIEEVNRVTLD